jgi:phosphomannomutase / phosphoglucomutase
MSKLFGTNGIRGVVNEDMSSELALGIGKAWGTLLRQTKTRPSVAIGTDARLSNAMLKTAISSGLLATGCDVVDVDLVPTPTLQYTIRERHHDSGVIITASHNPPQFNGIKGIAADGTEFSKDVEDKIEDIYFKQAYRLADWKNVGNQTTWDGAIDLYIKDILACVDVPAIKKHKFHIVLDCGNGAGSLVTPILLKKLGVTYTPLFCEPDGTFPGRNSEPIPDNLSAIMKAVPEHNADFGIAQDGDADRAIFIDENGSYIWGDKSLALAGRYLTKQAHGGIAVTPVTTSNCFEDVIKENGGQIVYTAVGSPIVARVMIEHQAVFGGEENGGLIFPKLQYCRDSAMSLAMFLEILTKEKQPLSTLIATIPNYEVSKSKMPCPNDKKQAVMDTIVDQVKDSSDVRGVDRTDGVKLFVRDGWVLMRPSGTEPIFRVYVQAKTKTEVEALARHYKNVVEGVIRDLSR